MLLSIILTASVLFPDATNEQVIIDILVGGGLAAMIIALVTVMLSGKAKVGKKVTMKDANDTATLSRDTWCMPPLNQLAPAELSFAAKIWMGILRIYLVAAGGLVVFRIVMLAIGQG